MLGEIKIEYKSCPVCNVIKKFRGSGRMSACAVDAHRCETCAHIFIDYQGDGLSYHKEEYRNNSHGTRSDFEIEEGRFTKSFHEARRKICEARLREIEPYLTPSLKCLDVGAGGGTFAMALKEKFSIATECQEISDICFNNLTNYGFKTHRGDFSSIDFNKTYDLVTCWHALEHIKDLRSFSQKAAEICSGLLVIEVPANRRLRNLSQEEWDGHYHLFSERSLPLLFEGSFSLIDIREGVQSPALLAIFWKIDQ
jgi:2-polyprenyl-3-methyl-5-hydroxy-6-metoxy-1,4-benzoquinol methylase